MGRLATRILAEMGLLAPDARTSRIIDHYERQLALGRMTLNTAYEQAIANIAGANGHPSKPQRTLKERQP